VTIPLKVAATFVKLAIPPPKIRTCKRRGINPPPLYRGGHAGDGAALPRTHLPVGVLLLGHQGQDGLGVLVGLLLRRGPAVLAVVGQLRSSAEVADGVTVDD